MGYQSWAGPPEGGVDINFYWGPPVINYVLRPMDIGVSTTNISDSLGNLLFYTNGYWIADITGDTMMNGSGIAPTQFITWAPLGLSVPQACLTIPKPGNNNEYFLFHSTLDSFPYQLSEKLYLTTIDKNQNSGLGAVTNKNQVLIQDSLMAGKITACKHANGRDWWVVVIRAESDIMYSLLITPFGISAPIIQHIGNFRINTSGQVSFSPDGTKFAFYYSINGLEIFDFDRCTGVFSNPIFIPIGTNNSHGGGLAFSGNSNVIYITRTDSVYQFDLTSTNIASSQFLVAAWDSFYSPTASSLATLFYLAELAPDGKIYITTGNSTLHLHVINEPDKIGTDCDFVQHGVALPAFYYNSLPNHPNYFLGKIPGSPCDTIIAGLEATTLSPEGEIRASPNPSNGIFSLTFPVQSESGELEVFDVNGKVIYRELVASWSQIKRIDLSAIPRGVYMCRMRWVTGQKSVKVVVSGD